MSTASWQVVGLALSTCLLLTAGVWVLIRRRETPEKRERNRRLSVNLHGRLSDGIVTDIDAGAVYYSYVVAGVEYCASQDIHQLSELLPAEVERAIGPVTLKYSPRNPANSIVVCEVWSGLRTVCKTNKEVVSQ